MTDASSNSTNGKPKAKAKKRVAGLRPRSGNAMLNNPALAGADTVVARSALGNGNVGTAQPDTVEHFNNSPHAPARIEDSSATVAEAQGAATALPGPSALVEATPIPEAPQPEQVAQAERQVDVPINSALVEPQVDSNDVIGGGDERDETIAASDSTDQLPADDMSQADAEAGEAAANPGETATDVTETSSRKRASGARGRAREKKASPQSNSIGPAHAALWGSWRESRLDLKLRKKDWKTQPFRFAVDLVASLSERVASDCASSGRALTAAQYIDAAMSLHLPSSIEDQLKLAEEFLRSRDADVGAGQQGSHRVSPAVYEIASKLPNALRGAGHGRTAVHVYSGALDRFLKAIDEEGPLGDPPSAA